MHLHRDHISRLTAIVLFCLLFPSQLLCDSCVSARSIHVGLHASWPHTMCSAEATAWIVHNMGSGAAFAFLEHFASRVKSYAHEHSDSDLSRLRYSEECELVHAAFSSQASPAHPLVSKTLNWVLMARQYSPLVHLHYSIANETLKEFRIADSLSTSDVFAVKITSTQLGAEILSDPSQIEDCNDCPTFSSSDSVERLSAAKSISGEVVLSGKCSNRPLPRVLVYANLGSFAFEGWLRPIKSLVEACNYEIVLRFWSPTRVYWNDRDTRPGLQGFTVQAALKSTEYKVIDDRVFSTKLFQDSPYGHSTGTQIPELPADEFSWRNEEVGNSETYTGFKAFRFLTEHPGGDLETAIALLQSFTEDGPSVARSRKFKEQDAFGTAEEKQVLSGIRRLREKIGDGDYLFINRIAFDLASVAHGTEDLFRCLSMTSIAAMRYRTISSVGGPSSQLLVSSRASKDRGLLRVDLDISRKLNSSLVWFNDLMKDSRYKSWKSLDFRNQEDALNFRTSIEKKKKRSGTHRNSEHHQLVKVKSHHLSLVILLDAGNAHQFPYTGVPQSVVRADLPIRVGLALVPNGRASSLVAGAFHYFLRMKGRKTCVRFLQIVQQVLEYMSGTYRQVSLSEHIVELAFEQIASEVEGGYGSAAEILERDEDIIAILAEARAFADEKGLFSDVSQDHSKSDAEDSKQFAMLGIFNGIVLKDISADVIRVAIAEQERIGSLLEDLSFDLKEDKVVGGIDWIESDPTLIVVETLSREMKAGDQRSSSPFTSEDDIRRISSTVVFSLKDELKELKYMNPFSELDLVNEAVITVWLVSVDQNDEVFETALSFMKQIAESPFAVRTRSRYALIDRDFMLHEKLLDNSSLEDQFPGLIFVINGRILPISEVSTLLELKVEVASEFVNTGFSKSAGDEELLRVMLSKDVADACASKEDGQMAAEKVEYDDVLEAVMVPNLSGFTFETKDFPGRHMNADLEVFALVNPFGTMGGMASSLLTALRETYASDRFAMKIAIVPLSSQMTAHHDAPSTFSKFVIGSRPILHGSSARASFHRLPENKVLTISVDPPRAWFVSSYATNYDMDNVVLASLSEGVQSLHAEYELKNLIVEGSCIDEEGRPPQGLKLILENEGATSVDTIVMANLGYFQLKVPTPGRWFLRLAEGPSREIFSLRVMEMYSASIRTMVRADSYGRVPILVESLSGAGGILLRVERRPGMEARSVLDPNKTEQHRTSVTERLKTKLSSFYQRRMSRSAPTFRTFGKDSDCIHVFSVASGHLYERFLKIMMTSVTKHASRRVKFWLLENYLSPSFKKVLPLFAKRLGCEVGMVTYKWPAWLRTQTEKQRIIWAYKILFLDVLFPLDVSRIIFVDSDQAVRGDLAELMDIDLNGAPYGYVPFCDSRKEVEGYRFWKQGFWKETLRDAKYRISALYVVDLVRFRETSAGDTLRFIYQSLSADPNSLSNLDQDLPNYASVSSVGGGDVVPIFDLPADWLWCESWCDDESKKTAKTIDLCNNPMTKEPKLESAKRIIDEWQDYDNAASRLTEEIYRQIGGVGQDSKNSAGAGQFCSAKVCPTHEQVGDPNSRKMEL